MRLGECAEALELTMSLMGRKSTIHPVVLWEGREGVSLVDAGYPGQLPDIESGLSGLGLKLKDVRRIFLTHQDLDHIGSAEAVQAATGAEVYAHAADKPYIEGEKRLVKMDPARWEDRLKALPEKLRHEARLLMSSPPTVKVLRVLQGGEVLPFHGGIEVIATPGHTPGHVCYFVTSLGLLISGDALRVENGELTGPSPGATPDMPAAIESLKNLLRYPIRSVICYHGGFFSKDPIPRIREISETPVPGGSA
jgi:glyoxylase-like metal-dependent hydrolase (beta-lactamase superfamily II)